jgi:orotidine-5'-phosphate decarboxylase
LELILDIDQAPPELRNLLIKETIEGVWGYKIGDRILQNGLEHAMHIWAKRVKAFVDLKHYDVPGRIERIVSLYAEMNEFAPRLLTISGECSPDALRRAVLARGRMHIVVTTVLSDDSSNREQLLDKLNERTDKAFAAGAQGITCPARLLPELDIQTLQHQWRPEIVATGVVSNGVSPRHHTNPRTVEFARDHGATYAVIGTEVIAASEPMIALYKLAERALKPVAHAVDVLI